MTQQLPLGALPVTVNQTQQENLWRISEERKLKMRMILIFVDKNSNFFTQQEGRRPYVCNIVVSRQLRAVSCQHAFCVSHFQYQCTVTQLRKSEKPAALQYGNKSKKVIKNSDIDLLILDLNIYLHVYQPDNHSGPEL